MDYGFNANLLIGAGRKKLLVDLSFGIFNVFKNHLDKLK
jgi:hypothetical protein